MYSCAYPLAIMSRLNRSPGRSSVGQRAVVLFDDVLAGVGLQVHLLTAQDGLGLRRGRPAKALHRLSRLDRSRVSRPIMRILRR